MNLAVVCGIAITTAVLTGALIVGDSVRGSLRDLTLDRLGSIHHALVSERFFDRQLASRISGIPAIVLRGTATLNQRRASEVNIYAVDPAFFSLFGDPDSGEKLRIQNGPFPSVLINESLSEQLTAAPGDEVLLSFARQSDIHRETVLGNRDPSEVVQRNRFKISAILPNQGPGRFGLSPNQNLPLIAYVPLDRFQRILQQRDKINAMYVFSVALPDLKRHLRLTDFGLKLEIQKDTVSLESSEVILTPYLVRTAAQTAEQLQLSTHPILTYLANRITYQNNILPYSTVTAITPPQPFVNLKEEPVTPLGRDEILLNEWAAKDLGIGPGEKIRMSYYAVGPANQLITKEADFVVKDIIRMQDTASDRSLAPEYPGIQDAENMSDWSPPFPVDLSLIRPQDENYWDQFRATPKAFVSEETGKRLWSSRFGTYTSLRFGIPSGSDASTVLKEFEASLLKNLDPAQMNLAFQPVREQGLKAASGATDFGGLFIGFSFFLILSSVMLVGLLFRLAVEQRKKEIGLLLACGYPQRRVMRSFLLEGGLITIAGSLTGTLLSLAYAASMIAALQSWWIRAIGSSFLSLHASPVSLITGSFISLLVCLLTIRFSIRSLTFIPATVLMAGSTTVLGIVRSATRFRIAGLVSLSTAFVATLFALKQESATLFFTGGACFLTGGLLLFGAWLRRNNAHLKPGAHWITTLRMSMRNSTRNAGRSMLSLSLVACASFVILAVGASRRDGDADWQNKSSGTGGFGLVAQTDIPVFQDLNTDQGRNDLGITEPDALRRSRVFGFRLRPGDDASCLNLYQPLQPRILGASQEFIDRGGFSFQNSFSRNAGHFRNSEKPSSKAPDPELHYQDGFKKSSNPWTLLNESLQPGVIPAIGDYNSARWILHKKIGEDIALIDDRGNEVKLRLVALLQGSLLQSELIISESNFVEHFPDQGGHSYFLIETDPDMRDRIGEILEAGLSNQGFDAIHTEEKLAAYHAVENTYLSTFQVLGGLGLLLGTVGLGIILIRNVIERRNELASMRAFGFQRSTLAWMVVTENAFLLAVGIAIAFAAALISVLPHLLTQSSGIPWLSLIFTLALVFTVGMIASFAGLAVALRIPLIPALKGEE